MSDSERWIEVLNEVIERDLDIFEWFFREGVPLNTRESKNLMDVPKDVLVSDGLRCIESMRECLKYRDPRGLMNIELTIVTIMDVIRELERRDAIARQARSGRTRSKDEKIARLQPRYDAELERGLKPDKAAETLAADLKGTHDAVSKSWIRQHLATHKKCSSS